MKTNTKHIRIIITLIIITCLTITCNRQNDETIKANEIISNIEGVEHSNINQLRFFASELRKIKGDKKWDLIGQYYQLVADLHNCYTEVSINNLIDIYPNFKSTELEKYRFKIDYTIITYYYYHRNFKKASDRLESTLEYAKNKDYHQGRDILIFGVTSNSVFLKKSSTLSGLLEIEKKLQDKPWGLYQSKINFNKSNYYLENDSLNKAKELLKDGYIKDLEMKIYPTAISKIKNLAYFEDENLVKHANLAIETSIKSGYLFEINSIYRLLGHHYSNIRDFKKALFYYKKAIRNKHNCDSFISDSVDLIYYGFLLSKFDLEKGLEFIDRGIKIGENEPTLLGKFLGLQRKIWIYESINDKQKIEETKREYNKVKLLKSYEKEKSLNSKVNMLYSLNEKESKIEKLEIENTIYINKLKIKRYSILGILLLSTFLSYIIYFYYQRINYLKRLKLKNLKIDHQNQLLKIQLKQLAFNNKALESFANLTEKELNKRVSTIENLVNTIKANYNSKIEETDLDYLNFIIDGSQNVKKIISGLLKFSSATKNLPKKEAININHIIEEIKENNKEPLKEKNISLKVKNPLPLIQGHYFLFSQLFSNIITNSIKYSKPSISNRIIIDCTSHSKDFYLFSVQDFGIGISKENQEVIFELFKKIHSKDEFDGHGIGLALAKKIVDEYFGTIWVESELNIGTTVFFTLPKF